MSGPGTLSWPLRLKGLSLGCTDLCIEIVGNPGVGVFSQAYHNPGASRGASVELSTKCKYLLKSLYRSLLILLFIGGYVYIGFFSPIISNRWFRIQSHQVNTLLYSDIFVLCRKGKPSVLYILPNTLTPIEEWVLNRIKYHLRS